MSEWQPIETAPRDGTQVLLWGSYNQSVCVGAWRRGGWDAMHEGSRVIESESDFGTDYKKCDPPSHWMPLPEPPAALMPEQGPSK